MNSRNKGKVGEREACRIMEAATGEPWRRTAQVRGKNDGAPDIEPVDPNSPNHKLWVEVKRRQGWYVGCKAWRDAWETTVREAKGRRPLMIWRGNGHGWQYTALCPELASHTATFDSADIAIFAAMGKEAR